MKLPLLKEAVDLDDNDVRSLTAYANALVKNKEAEKAFKIFERALAVNEKKHHHLE